MDNYSCLNFFQLMGWHCKPLSITGQHVTYFSTPLILPGGKPLDFYIQEDGEFFLFTDDRLTLVSLSAIGYSFENRGSWKGIANIASKYGFEMSHQGEITAKFHKTDIATQGQNILMLLSEVILWEEERRALSESSDQGFLDEIEQILKLTNPDILIERNPRLDVDSTILEFSFKWGTLYIDGVKPIAQSINSRLRKALLAEKVLDDAQLLFVVDDRLSPAKAIDELNVLGKVASATLLKNFKASSLKNQVTH